jgi:4-hydroxythreonine-4-phosphate dehydrogenase
VSAPPRLVITAGDPAGVGPEVVLQALADPALRDTCRPIVVGDLRHLRRVADARSLDLELVAAARPADSIGGAVPVLDLDDVDPALRPGEVTAAAGRAAWDAIEAATALCLDGAADALVTAPIHKVALDLAGHGHEGHTEILQRLTASPWSQTLYVLGELRVLFYSRHLSLRDAIDAVRAEPIADMLERFAGQAPRLGLHAPRFAVAALNPHAGEGGRFGREEIDHIAPGVELARARGLRVEGPIPADSVFHLARDGRYDVILSLYHDQAAGVLKSIDFHGTVSITLGLPFLRFSVDHGTAHDIAGTGRADAANMRRTLEVAVAHAGRARQTA